MKRDKTYSNSGGWLTKLRIAAVVLFCGFMIPGNVMAAENSENVAEEGYSESGIGETDDDAASSQRLTSDNEVNKRDDDREAAAETGDTGGVYDFKDTKTTGTITVVKEWDDQASNDTRAIVDFNISAKKPSKSTLGYTVTFHGNGMKFADGSEENIVIYNSAGEIVQGEYKMAVGNNVIWSKKPDGVEAVEISNDGILSVPITEDIDLWAKDVTFEIKGCDWSLYQHQGNGFNESIPSTVTEVIFTDEIKPASAEVIDVDADGDGGVVAWTENDGTVMKVSTQIKGIKVQAAVNSSNMFYDKSKIRKIDFKMLNTSNVTNMSEIFRGCNRLTSLDLTPLDTSKVTSMYGMFCDCYAKSLDLTGLDTSNVKYMGNMFYCSGLTSLDLTPLDTSNVTDMSNMFFYCGGLTKLDLSPMNTSKVTNMHGMFSYCSGLTSLDLTPLDTSNVTRMDEMFWGCSGLTSLDLTPLDTSNVKNMNRMFYFCSRLTTITTGPKFKFVGTDYYLSGTWQNTAGETFTNGTFPSNVADTYTKI